MDILFIKKGLVSKGQFEMVQADCLLIRKFEYQQNLLHLEEYASILKAKISKYSDYSDLKTELDDILSTTKKYKVGIMDIKHDYVERVTKILDFRSNAGIAKKPEDLQPLLGINFPRQDCSEIRIIDDLMARYITASKRVEEIVRHT